MNKTLSTYMGIAFTILVVTVLLIQVVYDPLEDLNSDYQSKHENYQILEK